MGSTAEHDTANLHFPGIAPEAAKILATRGLKGVGIDTASLDNGPSKNFETHQILYTKNVPAFENLGDLSAVPVKDFFVIAMPMKIAGGSGGPLRVAAIVP